MAISENKFCGGGRGDLVCIEANHVLDSCRDRDCFENAKVYLTDFGQEIIEHTGNVRVRNAEITSTCITIDPVQFNRGFYAVNIRFFVTVCCEACVGGRSQEFEGVAAIEKRVILFGGESGVSTYKSGNCENPCNPEPSTYQRNTPTATVDVAAPVVLDTKIMEEKDCCCNCCCCCHVDEIPDRVSGRIGAPLSRNGGERSLVVSLGIFSVVRITRPGQYLVNATEYSVPDKECSCPEEKNACTLFRSMSFPVEEFSSSSIPPSFTQNSEKNCGCGCGH